MDAPPVLDEMTDAELAATYDEVMYRGAMITLEYLEEKGSL